MFDALERLAKDKATSYRELGDVIGCRGKAMQRLRAIRCKLLAARKDIGKLARGLLGRAHHAHMRSQRMANGTRKQRKMRASKHHGVNAVPQQGLDRRTD